MAIDAPAIQLLQQWYCGLLTAVCCNVAGFTLDEGLASPSGEFTVFWGERKVWWLRVRATGPVGHGSRFVEDSAVEQLVRTMKRSLATSSVTPADTYPVSRFG